MRRKKRTILLVEDDETDLMAITRAFRQTGTESTLCAVKSGEDALAFLRREGQFADAPRPSVILLDLAMPRMNGHEFLQIIKSDLTLQEIPVVALTASQAKTDIISSYKQGAAGYIVKPLDFERLVEAVTAINFYWTLSELPQGVLVDG
jgi:CheY-like chemotaxis protein